MLQYSISPADTGAHLFVVRCTVPAPDPQGQRFTLPAWLPGSYLVRDFARHIVSLRAECDGQPVAVEKTDKQSWQCLPCAGPLSLEYTVYAFDESVRTAYLDATRGFFNGSAVFLRVEGQEDQACQLQIEAPAEAASWRLATTMTPDGAEPWGFGRYCAANYAELIDHPVEMADFDVVEYEAAGVPHAMVLSGRHAADGDRLARDLARLCETEAAMFGGLPMSRYLFLTRVTSASYGGLEHLDSSALICARKDLPAREMRGTTENYRNFLGLCSHEYFHLWNVKRIAPAAVVESDLAREAHFKDLWAYEGVTSYYDDLLVLRAGLIKPNDYLDQVAKTATRIWRTPGRFKQSLAESSFDAWTKFYQQNENSPNALVSYYAKGALVVLCLDLKIRLETQDEKNMDDVMRAMWQRYGADRRPVPDGALEAVAQEISGLALTDFFNTLLRSTEDPPLQAMLEAFGVEVVLESARHPADRGGRYVGARAGDADPGWQTRNDNGRLLVATTVAGGAAQRAGVNVGDELVACDGLRVTGDSYADLFAHSQPGQIQAWHVFRDGQLVALELCLDSLPVDTWRLRLAEDCSAEVAARRLAWLGAPA
ncbi:MAG: M61 family metallopeptidase [Nevskiales bacterium]